MSIRNREDIRDLINKIETSYPVNEWMHNGYHIWPVIRTHLVTVLIRQNENLRNTGGFTDSKNYGFFFKLIRALSAGIRYHLINQNKYKTLYFSSPPFRAEYLGKLYNKYFDFDMDDEGLVFEYYADSKKNFYNSGRVILFSELLRFFRLFDFKYWFIESESEYPLKINSILLDNDVEVENIIGSLKSHIHSVDRNYSTCFKILKKIKPKKIYLLWYYSNRMLGLNIAADKLNIPTYEMQVGPYFLHHDSWKNIPERGYEALPNVFQTWDKLSAKSVRKWAEHTTKHSSEVTGNPWVEGWKNGKCMTTNYQWPDKIILYTLQPIGNPLEPYLLETIQRTSDKWNWWLRLHPRQGGELEILKNKLLQFGVLDKVNINDATKLPLPEILVNTNVHLTKFSGSAIEAFNFDVPTIILDRRGEENFNDYLDTDKMISYTAQDSGGLISRIISLLPSSKEY